MSGITGGIFRFWLSRVGIDFLYESDFTVISENEKEWFGDFESFGVFFGKCKNTYY